MSALAANVQGEIIPECGHWVADEQPEYIIAALRKFFGSVTTPREANPYPEPRNRP